jgi:osmotically inducible protein OsmC
MPTADSTATTTWQGDLAHGGGTVSLGSGAAPDLEVTWTSRTSRSAGKTSPEELVAAAHAACFAMALSHELSEAGHRPDSLDVSATVTFDTDAGPKVTTSAISVEGRVPGIDQAEFKQFADATGAGCPVGGALQGNVEITVDAKLVA